ncbi:MAG: DNA topoisomerase VI subunit B, partial [Bdellovibrionales bacterium]|nr:DNA topoisomerase VI subunit B [Bdellovibrionales bacterium]
ISAATTWAQLTNATGVKVTSKTSRMKKAVQATIDVDIKGNKGLVKNKTTMDWDRSHGLRVEFRIDGRIQLKGDGGILTYLEGTTLVNPHLALTYELLEDPPVSVESVSDEIPAIPPSTLPHPHTMKLGEFMTHAALFGKIPLSQFLKKGFSRVSDAVIKDMVKKGLNKALLPKSLNSISETEFKKAYQVLQDIDLMPPTTRSVLTVGEEGLSKSIQRLGEVDFFSVVTRRPKICDFKPVVVEVAIARFLNRGGNEDKESPVQLLRFANRVPLQFDKGACAITRSVESVNWRSYGLGQQKNSLPTGPYVFAVSVTSPFIKFKNASKETIDGSDELVEEIRRALMQAGQKLSKHIRAESKAADLERKLQHIEKFGPILVEGLVRIVNASKAREKRAEEGLQKLLGRDTDSAEEALKDAEEKLSVLKAKEKVLLGDDDNEGVDEEGWQGEFDSRVEVEEESDDISSSSAGIKKRATKKVGTKKTAAAVKTTKKTSASSKTTKKQAAKMTKKAAKKAPARKK